MRVQLTEAERKQLWTLWKDSKLHISEVVVRLEELVGNIVERTLPAPVARQDELFPESQNRKELNHAYRD
jgi:hypothetical protein